MKSQEYESRDLGKIITDTDKTKIHGRNVKLTRLETLYFEELKPVEY